MNISLCWSLWSTAPRTRPSTSAHRIWPRSAQLTLCPRRRTWTPTSLAAASTDFAASCDGQGVECGANISLYNSNSQTFSESTNLPPQGSGYLQLMLMVPKGWQNLQITYMPTFVADKTITFNMAAADMTRA